MNWYSSKKLCVKWGNSVSDNFHVKTGLRQDSQLTSFLFSVYIAVLIDKVVQPKIGCNIGGIFSNTLPYADENVILI